MTFLCYAQSIFFPISCHLQLSLELINFIFTVMITVVGIIIAAYIGYKQIKISENQLEISLRQEDFSKKQLESSDQQLKLSYWQFHVDCIRWKMDKILSEMQELRLK